MQKRSIVVIAICVCLGISGGVVWYQYRDNHEHGHDGYAQRFLPPRILIKKLALDEAQQAELKKLSRSLIDSVRAGRESLREQRIVGLAEILSLLEANKINQEKALEMVRERLATVESYAREIISSAAGFTDSLSTEQRRKLQQIIEQRTPEREHDNDD